MLTRSEIERVSNLTERARESLSGGIAKGDGNVVDALDVVFANDDGLKVLAGLDGLGDADADDSGLGEGEEGGGSEGDGETHVGG